MTDLGRNLYSAHSEAGIDGTLRHAYVNDFQNEELDKCRRRAGEAGVIQLDKPKRVVIAAEIYLNLKHSLFVMPISSESYREHSAMLERLALIHEVRHDEITDKYLQLISQDRGPCPLTHNITYSPG